IVELVKLDHVLLQPLQAGVAGLRDVLARPVLDGDAVPRNVAALAGHVSATPVLAERLAQHLFAAAVAVDIGCVEEVDAEVERATHGSDGILLRRFSPTPLHAGSFAGSANRPRTKTDLADFQTRLAKHAVSHKPNG